VLHHFCVFFSGISECDYAMVHTLLCTTVLDLWVMRGSKPTDDPKTVVGQKGKEAVFSTSSVVKLDGDTPGIWGKVAETMKDKMNIYPKILVGPISTSPIWVVHKGATTSLAHAAVQGAVNVRGGRKSYWTKILNSSGFSVSTDHVNRMRMLVALATGVLQTEGTKVQVQVNTSDIDVVESSLKKLGYARDRYTYLVAPDIKVRLSQHPLRDKIHNVQVEGSVYVAVNEMAVPPATDNEKVNALFPQAMAAYRETIPHKDFCVWTPVFAHDIKGTKVITIRPPHDFYAVLTTKEDYVLTKMFPDKKVMDSWETFCSDVVVATSAGFTQMFAPLKLRSTSMEFLNILHYDIDTTRLRIGTDKNWECVGVDDARFTDNNDDEEEIEERYYMEKEREEEDEKEGPKEGEIPDKIDVKTLLIGMVAED